MAELNKWVVVAGRKATTGVVATIQAMGEVREATTGQVVEKVWAVAAPKIVRPESQKTRALAANASQGYEQQPAEELSFYRKYTERLLSRYVQMTMEAGRVSSLMGREVLGGRASSYRVHGFDDAVIFRLDVEKCLRQLQAEEREVVRRIAIQEYTHQEAADLLQLSLRTVGKRYARSIDKLTAILLRTRLLEPLKGCQVA